MLTKSHHDVGATNHQILNMYLVMHKVLHCRSDYKITGAFTNLEDSDTSSASPRRHLGDLSPSVVLEVVALHGANGFRRLAPHHVQRLKVIFKGFA